MSITSKPELAVNLAAVAHNTRRFAALSPGLMAVVKADGFGHGAADIARTALANGAGHLGVTGIDEALALRGEGITAPILSWLNGPKTPFADAIHADVTVAVNSLEVLDRIAVAASTSAAPAKVHLFADTGMERDGAPLGDWLGLCRSAKTAEERGEVTVTGVMSHLGYGNEPDAVENGHAIARFKNAVQVAVDCGLRPRLRHLAATAAGLGIPAARFDLLRVGAGLYGIDPAGGHGLRHALTLSAPVILVRDVPAGTAVGYGHTYRTIRPTRLALLPLGYADGIPVAAANTAQVSLHGQRCLVVGAVSMDQIVVDVGALPVRAGDTATVFGPGRRTEPTVTDWARWCQTIEHELMTRIGPRVDRTVHSRPHPTVKGELSHVNS